MFVNPNRTYRLDQASAQLRPSSVIELSGSFAILIGLISFAAIADAEEEPLVQPIRVALPSEIFASAGVESNIYFDNVALTLNAANLAFDVTCAKGRHQAERWTWTPTDSDAGEFPFEIVVRDDQNRLVGRAQTTVKVIAPKPESVRAKSLLLIGDSLTHASVYSQRLLDLSARFGEKRLTLVGSHGLDNPLGANRHEGYGGWTALRFATHFSETAREGDYTKRGSPFLYKQDDGQTKLDFARYCRDVNQGQFPDAVTIFLGPNDIFSYTDETISKGVESMLTHYDTIIEMIRSTSPSTRLGVMLPVPPAASQDAFGNNYGTTQTRWQYRRNQHALVEAMIKRYSGRRGEGIQLIATHANLDCVHNYPTESVAPNAHSDQKIMRQSNAAHPAVSGYRQIGDTVFCWLASLP